MRRYRVRLAYPRGRVKTEITWAADARVVDGVLRLVNDKGDTVAIYRPAQWTICRAVD